MKKHAGTLDATPSKRSFLAIIADYDLKRSICELVDNALDIWVRDGRSRHITIGVLLDEDQRIIRVEDNAGGVREAELEYLVGPGQTGSKSTDETIGLFGVGIKRAVIALAQDIRITTRYRKEATYQINFDESWLQDDDDWILNFDEVDPIAAGATIIELHRLRVTIGTEAISQLKNHLSTTYAKFLTDDAVTIKVNGETISPQFFENWAYPPGYSPIKYIGTLTTEEGDEIEVEAMAGLTCESSPATGDYGVYFYCNDRLIARAMKTFEVGFTKGLAGAPHPKVSLTRVLVSLHGHAGSMPWNSSKSDIDTKHRVFLALHDWLVHHRWSFSRAGLDATQ